VFYLERVAQSFNYPCKKIAIVSNAAYLRWSHVEHAILIANHGLRPSTVREAQLIARERKSDISLLVSSLDVAFILTNLYSPADQGFSSVVAEALREAGVLTVTLKPTGREIEGYSSISSVADFGFEVPLNVIQRDAFPHGRGTRGQRLCDAIAQICRVITFSLAKARPIGTGAGELRSILRGDNASAVGYGVGDGVEGCFAAFEAARKCPLLDPDKIRTSRGLMLTVEAKPGILKDKDTRRVRSTIAEIAKDLSKLHFSAFENEGLDSDYRVTILSRG
jgi:cell division GTPase FtsZ